MVLLAALHVCYVRLLVVIVVGRVVMVYYGVVCDCLCLWCCCLWFVTLGFCASVYFVSYCYLVVLIVLGWLCITCMVVLFCGVLWFDC